MNLILEYIFHRDFREVELLIQWNLLNVCECKCRDARQTHKDTHTKALCACKWASEKKTIREQ